MELPPGEGDRPREEEDTLHPEDGVRLPGLDAAAPAEATMVVSGEEFARALEASAVTLPQAAGGEGPGEWEGPERPAGDGPAERVSAVRLALAFCVIAALIAAIVLLVLEALPR
jgi:hypothetical protein